MRSRLLDRARRGAAVATPAAAAGVADGRAAGARLALVIRVAVASALLLLTVVPLYRLLDPERTGIAGAVTVARLDIYSEFAWAGLLLLLPAGIVAARLLSPARLEALLQLGRRALLRPSPHAFALTAALAAALAGALFSLLVLDRSANLMDALAQLLQARYWAHGQLAGPASDLGGFWGIQNALFTDRGWVSQYPPGHVALLVPFHWLGAPWLFGPVLIFITVLAAGLLARRLFPDDAATARAAVLLLALSPFFIFVGASLMNHITTAACTCLGGYLLVRAWQQQARWSVAAGALFALSLATRPLSTIAIGVVFVVGVPLLWPGGRRRAGAVALGGLLGAAPVVGAWLAYNQYFFGAPFTSGYRAALGPSMSLGFHVDPWGNWYGLREALAYTSADLTALAVSLFETPLPAVLVIALFLLVARDLPRAAWFVLAWALVPVLANALYWHHGLYMGPRMLHEAAPAWAALSAIAVIGILRRTPARLAVAGRYFVRSGVAGMFAAAFAAGLVFMVPQRALSHSVRPVPLPRTSGPALVFVHDAWNARTAMTLASAGLRLDLVETLLRQNSTCRVHALAGALASGDRQAATQLLAGLDTVPRPGWLLPEDFSSDAPPRARYAPAGQAVPVEIAPGSRLRYQPGEVLAPACVREVLSDRLGTIDIAPLLVRAGLHGDDAARLLIVRDLGPERNAALVRAEPARTPWVYAMSHPQGSPELLPYDVGMTRLWQAPVREAPPMLRRHGLLP
ncbi:MAG TPA: glycosyltransferase family 39 protein [Longimicrobiales bacterium]|nr:glycosyltransferase family 39 protein [Longimicrobiales bacterium]